MDTRLAPDSSGVVRGSCLCGGVRYALALPTRWVAHCHCSMCRRAHGAAFVTWAGFDAGALSIEAGELLHWYASSPGAERAFCSRCGSSLFFRSERWPGEVHATLANLDGELDRAPQAHAFWGAHVDWVPHDHSLPKQG